VGESTGNSRALLCEIHLCQKASVSSSGISVYQLEEPCFIYRHHGEYVPKVQLEKGTFLVCLDRVSTQRTW
jgi:hypothetical protein